MVVAKMDGNNVVGNNFLMLKIIADIHDIVCHGLLFIILFLSFCTC